MLVSHDPQAHQSSATAGLPDMKGQHGVPRTSLTPTKAIKRKPLQVTAVLVLICAAALLLWQRTHSRARAFIELAELSRADFTQIQKATRRAMWQKAFPSGVGWLISPRVVWHLATSRIRKIEVLGEHDVQVQVRSAGGDEFYHVFKKETSSGQSDWRVEGHVGIVRLGGWGGGNEVLVEGGMGLFGGSLYTGPDEEYLNSFLKQAVAGSRTSAHSPGASQSLFSGSSSNLGRLTYTNRPFFDPFGAPSSIAPAQRPAFSETGFSTWLSNHPPALKLGP